MLTPKKTPVLTLLALLAACTGPEFTVDTPREPGPSTRTPSGPTPTVEGGITARGYAHPADVLSATGTDPVDDGYVDVPDEGVLSEEWQDRLDARDVDYSAALRTASLRLRGDLPTLVEIRLVSEAPDPRAAYEALIDSFLEDPRFVDQMLRYFRDTMKMGGNAELDAAPVFATQLVAEDRPFTSLFNAPGGNCPSFDAESRTFTPGDCNNGVPAHAGVLTNPGVQRHYYSNLAFRRVRWVQETFACRPFPAEFDTPRDVGGEAPYTAPWPWESFAGADTGGRVDFHDTESVICGNCHATINHLAPLFGRFDDNGNWQDDFVVTLPQEGLPRATMSDWLPEGETTAWRYGVPAADLPALGAAMAVDEDVARCTVARLWNWAVGRGDIVNALAVVPESLTDDLTDTYFAGGYRLRPVIRQIFTANDFVRF